MIKKELVASHRARSCEGNLKVINTKTLCSVKKCKKLLYYKSLILQNGKTVQLLPIYNDKNENENSETVCKNSTVAFLNPVHMNRVRFKLKGGGGGGCQKIREFYLFWDHISFQKDTVNRPLVCFITADRKSKYFHFFKLLGFYPDI